MSAISLPERDTGGGSVDLIAEGEFKEKAVRVGAWVGRERVC